MDRRTMLRELGAIAAGAAAGRYAMAEAEESGEASKFFPGFKTFKFQSSGAVINGVVGGQGPPLLLLHGAPQSHIAWRIVAPKLASEYTIVAADLRGYGDSSK